MTNKLNYSMVFVSEKEEQTVFMCNHCGYYDVTFKGDVLDYCINESEHTETVLLDNTKK